MPLTEMGWATTQNDAAFEGPRPGVGLVTRTVCAPSVAVVVAGAVKGTSPAVTNTVVTALPSSSTTELAGKFAPRTRTTTAPAPMVTNAGSRLVMFGTANAAVTVD